MYTPRGFGVSELGDIEVVPDGDDLHLFHLTLPNHDVVQHAVSPDGLRWTPLPAALRTGDPGEIDDDQIWTMSVTPRPRGDGYLMLYTALATADDGRIQRVAAATSQNLIHWTKSPDNPVMAADARWYESSPGPGRSVSWRDPKTVRVGNTYLATICARENSGPFPRRGCVGLMVSHDLECWETRPPLFAPRRYWDLECPQLFSLGGDAAADRWYLTAAVMEDRTQRYWTASQAAGPWQFHLPPGGDILTPAGHYAARITRWQGMDLLFAWHQPQLRDGWLTSPRTVDWVDARNPFGKFLAPPLLLSARDDGRLALGSFPGWDDYRNGDWHAAQSDERTLSGHIAPQSASAWCIGADVGMDLLPATEGADDFVVEGSIVLNAARGGLALRLDGDGRGLYVELQGGSRHVSLQRWGTKRSEHSGTLSYAYDQLQSTHRSNSVESGEPVPFRLLSVGPYVEASFGGEVAIATMTGRPRSGQWGIWVEDGSCTVRDARWAPMRQPAWDGTRRSIEAVEEASIG